MFKSIRHKLILYTVLLVVAAAAGGWFIFEGYYIYTLIVIALIIYFLSKQLKHFDTYNKKIIFLLNALENGDYTYRFSDKKLTTREREMNMMFNRIKEILEMARTEVIQNEQFLSIILESVSTGIIIADERGIVHKVNRTALEMLGLAILTHLNQLQNIDETFPDIFMGLRTGESRQLPLASEKEEILISLRVSDIKLKRGMMRVLTLNNIGNELETKEMESWIRLIRVMTHEIMNSIAPITSLSETMMSLYKNGSKPALEDTLTAFETINSTASGLLSFVESYRKFTSVPAPKKEPFNICTLVEKVVQLHKQDAADKDIEISVETTQPEDEAIMTTADENQMQQVVINLLKNAMEVSDCKHIIIKINNEEKETAIEISNDGAHVPPEVLPHIFVPFFTTKPNGSGIGLSLSRYIMRLHGGKLIHYTSKDGRTVFRMALSKQ
ncbi:MAG: PAS domain-containing protein [Tannerella sp.]|jgi:nitrogen fixation/metabolism regulation signal transduction histidine kinase|nr:PAS domain-containing protein [Tannerella sp.]